MRTVGAHRIDALDDDIGCGEIDLGGARRLDREEADVAGGALHRVEGFAGAVDDDLLQRHAEPLRKLLREIDGDAARRPGHRVALHQHRIGDVERGAQRAGGGERFHDVGGGGGGHDEFLQRFIWH